MRLADSSEYKEGEAASCRGLTTRNNPYPFLSPEYWRWHEGLLGNCSNCDPPASLIEFLDDEDEAVVAIAGPEYLEPRPVLIGAS